MLLCINNYFKKMASIKGTQTEKNLLKAFAGESQARNKYTYFASQARKDDYPTIAAIFEETANHEKEHAKRFFKFLEGGEVTIESTYPAGVVGTTLENLVAAVNGEHEETAKMYPEMAKVAREEGFELIAKVFESVAQAEAYHEARYRKLIADVETQKIFKKEGKKVMWKCTNCGYHTIAEEAPVVCPACGHRHEYFIEVDETLF